jgi:hypothetical protein
MSADGNDLVWRKAPCDTGACVEVAHSSDEVLVRSSEDPDGARLTFTADAWRAFIDEVRAGAFEAD